MKGGTGTMMKWLNEHPQLRSGMGEGNKNEVHFFPRDDGSSGGRHGCTWTHYIDHFALSNADLHRSITTASTTSRDPHSRVPLTFDKSPDYMRSHAAMKEIRAMLPTAKLLALLREPVRRTLSAFNHNCKHNRYGVRRPGAWTIRVRKPGLQPGSDEVVVDAVVQLEWMAREATKSNILKCKGDGSECDALSEEQARDHFQVLPYPCHASHFDSYYSGAVTALLATGNKDKTRLHEAAQSEISFGYYDEQLRDIYSLFGDNINPQSARNSSSSSAAMRARPLEIYFQEDMVKDTASIVSQVLFWLHLPPLPPKALQALSSSQEGLAGAPGRQASRDLASDVRRLYPTLHQALQRLYKSHNVGLEALLDKQYGPGVKALPSSWSYPLTGPE